MSAVRAGRARRAVHAVVAVGLVSGLGAAHPGAAAAGRAAPATASGIISTVAGGVGGPAQATTVSLSPCGVFFNRGTMYVADGSAVREVNPSDGLTTPAGTGVSSGPGVGVPAVEANLYTCGAAVDHVGNLVIAEGIKCRVAVVAAATGKFYGQAMTAGNIYLVAGHGRHGYSSSG